MDATELKLECLKLAVTRANSERPELFLDRVAEIQTRFYNLVSGTPVPAPETEQVKGGRKKADKPAIFD